MIQVKHFSHLIVLLRWCFPLRITTRRFFDKIKNAEIRFHRARPNKPWKWKLFKSFHHLILCIEFLVSRIWYWIVRVALIRAEERKLRANEVHFTKFCILMNMKNILFFKTTCTPYKWQCQEVSRLTEVDLGSACTRIFESNLEYGRWGIWRMHKKDILFGSIYSLY